MSSLSLNGALALEASAVTNKVFLLVAGSSVFTAVIAKVIN